MSEETPEFEGEIDGEKGAASWTTTVIISVVILGVAGGLAALTFMTEPTAKKGGATKRTAMLVDVVDVERATYQPDIVAQGTVQPVQDVVLRPQVAGKVVSLGESFTPGGFVEKGDVVMRIEQADYRNMLAQRKSELRQALSDLAVEKGRQDAAKAEYRYLDEELSDNNRALVLREPQYEAAKQRVEAARAAVAQAELDLRRTTVRAPFDAHVLRRDLNIGTQISTGDTIGRFVGVDEYWVSIELPLTKLAWITVGGDGEAEGARVTVRNRQAWPEDVVREGRLFRMVGALDENTRMGRVLATIPDPMARAEGAEGKPRLIVGEFLEVTIEGNELDDVVRLNRDYLREDDTVWVMDDGKLRVQEAEVAVRDADYAYVTSGLEDGARVVTTNISTVVDGAELRLRGDESNGGEEGEGGSDE